MPVDASRLADLDMEQVVVAEMSDRADPRLLETFRYWENEGVIVGQVNQGGIYQAYAWPKPPWLRTAFAALCLHWKWVMYDPKIRKIAGSGDRTSSRESRRFVDRICQLILCTPEYARVKDPGIFNEMGVGLPPDNWSGGDICERCLGDFLGELEVIDDIYIRPPLVKWCWWKSERCSRWVSIGPTPGEDFGGIGRVAHLAIHPTNGNNLIAAAAGGGVWRTYNGGATWLSTMELQPTLTMGAVAYAPSNPSVRRARAYRKALAVLQDELGAFNDAAVAPRVAAALAGPTAAATVAIESWSAGRAGASSRGIAAAWSAFEAVAPFWKRD